AGLVGRAYVFSGATGALLHELASLDPEAGGLFGIWVAGVPDADGDGRGDLLVGASHEDAGAGRAHRLSGATGAPRYTLVSPHAEVSTFFGKALAGVPDADGDGRGDLLVSAFEEDVAGQTNVGRAYLFSGATGALLHTLLSPTPQAFAYFGRSVSGVPDADGDGRGDLLVGALEPVVHLFSGATGAHLAALEAPEPGGSVGFGTSVAGVPDADGDGRGDLLVGARFARDGGSRLAPGQAFVFSGATGALLQEFSSLDPEYVGRFGGAVSGVPDADGDGRGDFLVGAPEEDGGMHPEAGRGYLFTGGGAGGCAQDLSATVNTTTPPVGGTLTFTVTVTNGGAGPAVLDLWIDASGPTSLTKHLASGTLPAGASVTRALNVRVPGNAPTGGSAVGLHIGDFAAGDVCDTVGFAITVTAAPSLAGNADGAEFEVEGVEGFFAMPTASASTAEHSVAVSPNPSRGRAEVRYAVAEAAAV